MRRKKQRKKKLKITPRVAMRALAVALVLGGAIAMINASAPKPLPPESAALWRAIVAMDPGRSAPPRELETILGREIELAGFVIPDDASSATEMSEFLLTPISAGCIHVPPPPPNYVIRVAMAPGLTAKAQYGEVVVHGQLALSPGAQSGRGFMVEMTAQKVESL